MRTAARKPAAKPRKRKRSRSGASPRPVDKLDESLVETFPASDPPAWVPVVRIGPPKHRSGR